MFISERDLAVATGFSPTTLTFHESLLDLDNFGRLNGDTGKQGRQDLAQSQAAAAKIQARQRGQQERRVLTEQKQKQAAIRIQAIHRGKTTRQEQAQARAAAPEPEPEPEVRLSVAEQVQFPLCFSYISTRRLFSFHNMQMRSCISY